jgi:hypothetical protein
MERAPALVPAMPDAAEAEQGGKAAAENEVQRAS